MNRSIIKFKEMNLFILTIMQIISLPLSALISFVLQHYNIQNGSFGYRKIFIIFIGILWIFKILICALHRYNREYLLKRKKSYQNHILFLSIIMIVSIVLFGFIRYKTYIGF